MGQRLLASIAFAALLAGICSARSLGAEADRAGGGQLDSYCSPSGDFCTEIVDRGGRLKFVITAFAEYFDSYKVCVKGPSGSKQCVGDRLRDRGDNFQGKVDYLKNFDVEGPGTYKVIWRIPGSRLGEPLSFSAGAE